MARSRGRRPGAAPGAVPHDREGRRWDVLASDPAARALFTDWDARPAGERNLVRWMFTAPRAREKICKWKPEARAMLGRFRLAAARHPDDPGFAALIGQLQRDSEHVRDWVAAPRRLGVGSGSKKLRHPALGPLGSSPRHPSGRRPPRPDPGHLFPAPSRRGSGHNVLAFRCLYSANGGANMAQERAPARGPMPCASPRTSGRLASSARAGRVTVRPAGVTPDCPGAGSSSPGPGNAGRPRRRSSP